MRVRVRARVRVSRDLGEVRDLGDVGQLLLGEEGGEWRVRGLL